MTDATTAGSLAEGPTIEARESRLSEGASALAAGGRRTVLRHPQLLLTVAATLMTVGIVLILIAWFAIARSTMVEEQLAYLVSGGLLGVSLTTVGAVTLLAHWLTVLIGATREQTELLRQQQAAPTLAQEETNGRARSTTPRRPVRRASRSS